MGQHRVEIEQDPGGVVVAVHRQRPELFVRTLTEKLFIFALGRAPQESDAPAIRKIVRAARANDYRFSPLIVGLTTSAPFQMRMSQ